MIRGLAWLSLLPHPSCVWWIEDKLPRDSHEEREPDEDEQPYDSQSSSSDSHSGQGTDSRDSGGALDSEGGHETDSTPTTDTATPDRSGGIYLELTWAVENDDFDLHLLAPDGTLETSTDCFFSNCISGTLDWGERGEDADDPLLELDDIPGTGPEITRIARPEDGLFTVVVHDYPSHIYSAANQVLVAVYVREALALSCAFEVSGEDEVVEVASIDFPAAVVTPLVTCE